jgi:3-deoxy-D-manno-octulosonic-acid transferase
MTGLLWRLHAAVFTILYILALPFATALLIHRVWIRRKSMVGLGEKLSGGGADLPTGRILVHGVSLGEVMLMRPLIPKLEAAFGTSCVLTTTTETGRATLDQHFPQSPRAFLPFDLPWAVSRFIGRLQPKLVVLLELEIWPLLLCACYARGIPVVLVNARVSDKSYRGYRTARPLLWPLFRRLTLALGQNESWTERLRRLGVKRENAVVCGSMKADMVKRAAAPDCALLAQRLNLDPRQPMLLVASSSAHEEDLIVRAWQSAPQAANWRLIVCPRHPERGEEVGNVLKARGMEASRTSVMSATPLRNSAIVVDQIGQLGALYAACAASNGIAIVGGSLGSGRGGQNMLEAAAAGCCTVVGEDTRNFPDAMTALRETGGVVEVSEHSLQVSLIELAVNEERRRAIGEHGQKAWSASQGSCDRALAILKSRLSI